MSWLPRASQFLRLHCHDWSGDSRDGIAGLVHQFTVFPRQLYHLFSFSQPAPCAKKGAFHPLLMGRRTKHRPLLPSHVRDVGGLGRQEGNGGEMWESQLACRMLLELTAVWPPGTALRETSITQPEHRVQKPLLRYSFLQDDYAVITAREDGAMPWTPHQDSRREWENSWHRT